MKMLWWIFAGFLAFITYVKSDEVSRDSIEYLQRIEPLFLEFPMTSMDMQNWYTSGSAILQKNFATLVPEVDSRTGLMVNSNQIKSKHWILDISITVGNKERRVEASEGFSIFYLKEISQSSAKNIRFMYSKTFNGFGLVFDTASIMQNQDPGENRIIAVMNDNTVEYLNPFTQNIKICNALYKTGEPVDLRLKYSDVKTFTLFVKSSKSADYVEWMKISNIDLDYEGYLVIAGSNGYPHADFVFINSIKAFNTDNRENERLQDYEKNRKVHKIDFSEKTSSDTLHKYGNNTLRSKPELIKAVYDEGLKVRQLWSSLLQMSERYIDSEFQVLPKHTDIADLTNHLTGIAQSIDRVKSTIEDKSNKIVNTAVKQDMDQIKNRDDFDVTQRRRELFERLGTTLASFEQKIIKLNNKIDQTNLETYYNQNADIVKPDEFKNFAMEYSKEAGMKVEQKSAGIFSYILYVVVFFVVGFGLYVLLGKSS